MLKNWKVIAILLVTIATLSFSATNDLFEYSNDTLVEGEVDQLVTDETEEIIDDTLYIEDAYTGEVEVLSDEILDYDTETGTYVDISPSLVGYDIRTATTDDWVYDETMPYTPRPNAGIYSQEEVLFNHDGGEQLTCDEIGICYTFDIYDENDFDTLYPGEEFILDFQFFVNETGSLVSPAEVEFGLSTMSFNGGSFDRDSLVIEGFDDYAIEVYNSSLLITEGIFHPGESGRITIKGQIREDFPGNKVSFAQSMTLNYTDSDWDFELITTGPTTVVTVAQPIIDVEKLVEDQNGDGLVNPNYNGVGEILTYTIDIQNNGDGNDYDLTYIDSMLATIIDTPGLELLAYPTVTEINSYKDDIEFVYDSSYGSMYFGEIEAGAHRSGGYELIEGDHLQVTYQVRVTNDYTSDSVINQIYLDGTVPDTTDCSASNIVACSEVELIDDSEISYFVTDSDEDSVLSNTLVDGSQQYYYEAVIDLKNDFLDASYIEFDFDIFDGLNIIDDTLEVYIGGIISDPTYDYDYTLIQNTSDTTVDTLNVRLYPDSYGSFDYLKDTTVKIYFDVALNDEYNVDAAMYGMDSNFNMTYIGGTNAVDLTSNEVDTNFILDSSNDLVTAARPDNDLVTAARPDNDLVTAARPDNDLVTVTRPDNDLVTAARPDNELVTAVRPDITLPEILEDWYMDPDNTLPEIPDWISTIEPDNELITWIVAEVVPPLIDWEREPDTTDPDVTDPDTTDPDITDPNGIIESDDNDDEITNVYVPKEKGSSESSNNNRGILNTGSSVLFTIFVIIYAIVVAFRIKYKLRD